MDKRVIRKCDIEFDLLWLLMPLLVGIIATVLTSDMVKVYESIILPELSLPSYAFPIVWSTLYALMGVSSVLVYKSDRKCLFRSYGLCLNVIQLILNLFWPIIFFNRQDYKAAFIWIVIMWLTVLLMSFYYKRVNKLAFYMNIPYILWLTYAAYLNYFIFCFN